MIDAHRSQRGRHQGAAQIHELIDMGLHAHAVFYAGLEHAVRDCSSEKAFFSQNTSMKNGILCAAKEDDRYQSAACGIISATIRST